jgi:hypothetical protein
MKNRAKCKLCQSVLESFHRHDYVTCKCGEISITGGAYIYECSAQNWKNFLRIDDLGNEIIPKIIENGVDTSVSEETLSKNTSPLSKEEKIKELERMILSIEALPSQAMSSPISHYDLLSLLILLSSILRDD